MDTTTRHADAVRDRLLPADRRADAGRHLLGGAAHALDHASSTPPGRSVSPLQNGLALAGDYMSAASFLGIAGLVALSGYDGMIYATGWLVGWPALMFLIAEPLRNLGKFTFADVVAFRLRQAPVRIAAAFGGILTLLFYTIAQMVGAGNLITLMFGMPYEWAVVIVGAVMLALRALRRHDRDHLGADHQGDPAARRRDAADACWCWRSSTSR